MASKITIGYATDIEGNFDYWERYKAMSRVLQVDSRTGNLLLRDNCHFVFGGDVCDRGKGDIRIANALVKLKQTYPDRVHLILGNRDMNKLRFIIETDPKMLSVDLPPYWVRPNEFYSTNNAVDRVKLILYKTMGSGPTPNDSFEERRQELKEIKSSETGTPVESITINDDTVVASFHDSARVDGFMTKYLKQGQLGLILHDTLFVHGGVRDNSIGMLPFVKGSQREMDARKWVASLNEYTTAQMREYTSGIEEYVSKLTPDPSLNWACVGGYGHPQPGSGLLFVGMGWTTNKREVDNPSVIYSNFLKDGEQLAALPSQTVLDYCRANGIRRIVAGHQPIGDAPLLLAADDIMIVCADTTFARDVKFVDTDESLYTIKPNPSPAPASSTRGNAVTEVLIEIPLRDFEKNMSVNSTVTMHGVFNNGITYETSFTNPADVPVLGKEFDGWWSKAFVQPKDSRERHVLMTSKKGYTFENKIVPEKALQSPVAAGAEAEVRPPIAKGESVKASTKQKAPLSKPPAKEDDGCCSIV